MKILKLILFFIVVYFIRRFFKMYQYMKRIQEEQMASQHRQNQYQGQQPQPPKNEKVVDAEYKVID